MNLNKRKKWTHLKKRKRINLMLQVRRRSKKVNQMPFQKKRRKSFLKRNSNVLLMRRRRKK